MHQQVTFLISAHFTTHFFTVSTQKVAEHQRWPHLHLSGQKLDQSSLICKQCCISAGRRQSKEFAPSKVRKGGPR